MPNKALGQHWLTDPIILSEIADSITITPDDTVLEIGPGLGTLTSQLLRRAKQVVAVEFDAKLARKLPGQFPGTQLTVVNDDILQFDLAQLPTNYKVVANVPYYITSKIVDRLVHADNPPEQMALLVQKEVAQRIAATPGDMSLLALNAQLYTTVSLGVVVGREFFSPPPKVDSQVVVLTRRAQPLVAYQQQKQFFRVARAGFAEKRKKLRSSLAAGLAIRKLEAEALLSAAQIDPNKRAQDLSIAEWQELVRQYGL